MTVPTSQQIEAARHDDQDAATGPRSLVRLLALFDALSAVPDGLTLAELSATLGSPKSSLLNLLRPLVSEAYLIHSGGIYRPGPSMFRLASNVLDSWQMPKIVLPIMEQLAGRTGESVLLSVIDRTKGLMIYVGIAHSPHPVRYQISAGMTRPLYATTAGRVLLAYAERDWRQAYLSRVQFNWPMAVPVTKAWLKCELDRIRAEGLAWSVDSYAVGLSAVAAPVFDAGGECVACINVPGPTNGFRAGPEARKAAVKSAAAQASKLLAARLP